MRVFGYVAPLKSELRVKDLALYNAYYCGLCRSIKARYGDLPRITLSFDCTFLALLLDGVNGGGRCTLHRCGYKPFRKPRPMAPDSESLRFAADINILLAYDKCLDDWHDEHGVKGLAGEVALKGAANKAKQACPAAAAAIEEGLSELSRLEKASSSDLDAPADAFARLMRGVLSSAPVSDENTKAVLSHLGWHLGRWIYLIDAWDDRERDAKKGSYNPFNLSGAGEERASFLLHFSLNEAAKAYDLLSVKSNGAVLENILCLGCAKKTESLLKGEQHESV